MTDKPKHTPGPWQLETVRTSSGICHRIGPFPWKEGKDIHCCVYVDYPGNGDIERELLANARLIASAPDLLAALKQLAEEADNFSVSGVYFAEKCMGRKGLDMAWAAIEKAEGQ